MCDVSLTHCDNNKTVNTMGSTAIETIFGSLDKYDKGSVEIIKGQASHYAFSNIFEVAQKSAPYEKVVVGLNLGYVIETLRAEGQSPWFTAAHDEFAIVMDGEVRVDFLKLDAPLTAGEGTQLAGELPAGKPMGYVLLKRGHQCVLPAGTAYRFDSRHPGVILQQTIKGVLSVEKWADICLQ
ncbi:hypothetical protein SAMN04490207_0436 [Pseudomonas gessardii]|nr:hypothetical protein SAMN04490207_0436 [Pseudomonas gessardii]